MLVLKIKFMRFFSKEIMNNFRALNELFSHKHYAILIIYTDCIIYYIEKLFGCNDRNSRRAICQTQIINLSLQEGGN